MTMLSQPSLGVAYSSRTPGFLASNPDAVDHVELPFELLEHAPKVSEIARAKPVILHCASLSIAGSLPAPPTTLAAIDDWSARLASPWIGEHLSFISADRAASGEHTDEYAPGEPYNIGYTVAPPWNEHTLRTVVAAVEAAGRRLRAPLILENPPIYFPIPSSTMTQTEFIGELCRRSPVGLLLDLAHFYITSRTMGFDPLRELLALPLERVVEVHISGVDEEVGASWDNHASRAPDIEFELLQHVLAHGGVRAITLEYNWSAEFPNRVLLEEIARARSVTSQVAT
ncbi:DUF692 family multinuclear iron-containing protein [Kribbella sp. VKM Ac-2566]|uniref:DUF692 domain-containing protein n=1 Tax=Kribbella sp. VKM Ac-2566 TaxID=2512218 RepID=UPI0010626F12|nr:DUF692 family multinuclear iron-containing protein [Kribbella sp. VKM Ac-2566]TDW91132.1 hypothetical protein EV647_4703 [Kribbella sp. VKM Ac-2566]